MYPVWTLSSDRQAYSANRREADTREECTKYGSVQSVAIREITAYFSSLGRFFVTFSTKTGVHFGGFGLKRAAISCAIGSTNVPPEQAVRIFVHFEARQSAIKAQADLNGRFFGGN